MRVVHWIAAIALVFEMPVPVYWLVFHGPVAFWRKHGRIAYFFAVLIAWGGGGWLLSHFHTALFQGGWFDAPPLWAIVVGLALIATDFWLLFRVEAMLGGRRLVGQAELSGRGELATGGLYERVRHPRYLGMMTAVLGACVLVGSPRFWVAGAAWWIVALGVIHLEESELRRRFGAVYAAYAQRVPMLLPLRARLKQG
jgi:protein-S-isoprenylcysteine O-methyltransferase Ste14